MTSIYSQLAGMISFVSYAMYIVSTLQGKTKPSRSTWWILSLIGALIFTSSYSAEAKENLWMQGSYVVGPLIIAILSLKYGYGSKKLAFIDVACIVSAIFCLGAWVIFDSPFIAFLGGIIADFIALIPTVKKSYYDAHTEDLQAWIVEMVASLAGAFGVSICFNLSDLNWIYTLYLLSVNGLITMLLLRSTIIRQKIPV